MNRLEGVTKQLTWLMALVPIALAAGCGGGGGGGDDATESAAPVPTVTAITPLANTIGVPINTRIITASFTKAMNPATLTPTSFTLACPAGTPISGTVVSYLTTSNMAMLTLPEATLLPLNTVCTAAVTTEARDVSDIPLASNFTWTFMTGVASETTPATVTGTAIANGATNVATNTKISATFSEAMDPSTITTNTFTLKQGEMTVPGTVTYSGVSAVFTPEKNLDANTLYSAAITSGAKDVLGNALENSYVWSWTTGSAPASSTPTVSGTIHTNGATNVPINTKIAVTFSEGMYPLTINNTNFTLKETASGIAVAGIVSYSGVNATFMLLNSLKPNTGYIVFVKGGIDGVKDLAGNAMASDFMISWTTGAIADATAPTVSGTIHANGAANVAINTKVGATFSEGMDALTLTNRNFTLKETASGKAISGLVSYSGVNAAFIPSNPLTPNTGYTVTVKGGARGVMDLAGNPMTSDFVISWTTAATADITAPRIIGTIHANGAANVAINTKVDATFSEGMNPLTVTNTNFSVKETSSGTAVSGIVSYSGVNAAFIPLKNLTPNTGYTATVKGGARGVTDLAGNPLAIDYAWSWVTGAISYMIAPTVVSVSPVDHESIVPINKIISATFSEAMDPLTINSANFTVGGVTGTVTYDARYRVAMFKPASDLSTSTTYTATITTGTTDLTGNALAVDKVWHFSTPAYPLISPVINLRSASSFGILGGNAGVSSSGLHTLVNGDVGTTASSTAVTGLHDAGVGCIYTETPLDSGTVNGRIYTAEPPPDVGCPTEGTESTFAIATQARADALVAYNALVAMPAGANLTAMPVGAIPLVNLAGIPPPLPGTYTAPTGAFTIQGGNLILDANGDTDAVWVFQMATTLTVGGPGIDAPQNIILTGGAQAKNVFWQVGSTATINAAGGGTMVGTIIARDGVTFSRVGNSAIVTQEGRVLSLNGPVTLANTIINVPAP